MSSPKKEEEKKSSTARTPNLQSKNTKSNIRRNEVMHDFDYKHPAAGAHTSKKSTQSPVITRGNANA